MNEGLLSPTSSDSVEDVPLYSATTRQKKSASAPGVIIPNSLSQLENVVSLPCVLAVALCSLVHCAAAAAGGFFCQR